MTPKGQVVTSICLEPNTSKIAGAAIYDGRSKSSRPDLVAFRIKLKW